MESRRKVYKTNVKRNWRLAEFHIQLNGENKMNYETEWRDRHVWFVEMFMHSMDAATTADYSGHSEFVWTRTNRNITGYEFLCVCDIIYYCFFYGLHMNDEIKIRLSIRCKLKFGWDTIWLNDKILHDKANWRKVQNWQKRRSCWILCACRALLSTWRHNAYDRSPTKKKME